MKFWCITLETTAVTYLLSFTFSVLNTANEREKHSLATLRKNSLTMAGGSLEKVTLTKKALEGLKARACKGDHAEKELNKAQRVLKSVEAKNKKLEEELALHKQDFTNLKEEYDSIAEDARQKTLLIGSLERMTNNRGTTGTVHSKASTKPKVNKKDLNQELVNHVTQTAKTVLFRTWKFIEDSLEEEEVTRELIPYLPVDPGMSEEEFIANYSNIVYEAIKNARTEVQSNGKKRAKGTEILCILADFRGICTKYF